MPAKGPVSLVRQTIYCFIPIMDIYAAYNIKKLRWYLAVMIVFAIASSSLDSIIYSEKNSLSPESYRDKMDQGDWAYLWFGPNPELGIGLTALWWMASYVIAVFLIRRWSKQWNKQSFSIA